MLPGVDIQFQNGQLGQYLDTPDGVFGLLASAVAVSTTFALNTPYMVRGMSQVAELGITPSVGNYVMYKALDEFFAEAGEGTELWIMGLARTTKVSDWFTLANGVAPAHTLLNMANGKLRMLFTAFSPTGYVLALTDGLDSDLWVAMAAAQTLAENYTTSKYAPLSILFEGYGFDGNKAALRDLLTMDLDRCQVMLGDTETRTGTTASKGAAVGILAGRKAKDPVQRNPGRVRSGSLSNTKAYILDAPTGMYDITALHDKGYVTFRTHTGRSGYFFTDDPMACAADNDYHYGTERRVIDKAYRLTYDTTVDFVLDENSVNGNGTIQAMYAKTIETAVISKIYNQMTKADELSTDENDPRDRGVLCEVDRTNNVTSSGRLKFSKLQVRPKGHNRYIDVPLGFVPVNTNS